MTSSYPARHGVLSNFTSFQQPVVTDSELQTAAQMFRQAGYRTAAFISSGLVLGSHTGIGAGFQTFDPLRSRAPRIASETVKVVTDWLAKQRDGRFFLWVHFWDPHDPYSPPPEYERLFKSDPDVEQYVRDTGVAERHRSEAVEANNLYDGEIRFTDHWIGELFRAMQEHGVYDPGLIVLTSDHGEGLMQHGNMHHSDLFNDQLDIPLIIKLPEGRGQKNRRLQNLVSIIDVLPLIAEELDLPFAREQFDGLNPLRHERSFVIAEQQRSRKRPGVRFNFILRDLEWKYFLYSGGDDRLYDLKADYHEINDVIDLHTELAESMKAELLRQLERHRRSGSGLEVNEEIPADVREQLKSLGYVD